MVGESFSAADMVIFPGIQLLLRALRTPDARELSSRFLPLEVNYPALGRWLERVEALAGLRAHLSAALALKRADQADRASQLGGSRTTADAPFAASDSSGHGIMSNHKVHVDFPGRIVIVGLAASARACCR